MTAVNELNRQNLASNCSQQILSNDNELFCLSNALVDCGPHSSTLNQNQQFHSNQQSLQHNLNGTTLSSNLISSSSGSNGSLQSGNCLNGPIDGKKCDLNNNPINGQRPDLMGGKSCRTLNRPNGSLESTEASCSMNSNMNGNSGINMGTGNMLTNNVHHLQHNQSNEGHQHQAGDYSERINKSNLLAHNSLPAEDANCYPSYHTLHLNHPNHLNHLGQPLNGNSVNKLAVSGRRGRPPKKDSKSRNRQSRGKSGYNF